MKQIVICGAGFGGLSCALELSQIMPESDITIVDMNAYHVLHGFLYELASSDEELARMADIAETVSIPIKTILQGRKIKFQQAKVVSVDTSTKQVVLDHGKLPYDYVVLALGSTANFYGIPGAEDNAIPLKTPKDALAIRNKVQFAVEAARLSATRSKLRFVVAGGGFAGVELAAELAGLLDFLSWKNSYPREMMQLIVVEGAPQLMPGLGEKIAQDTFRRLDELGVEVQTKSLITNVTQQFIELNTGDKMHYDGLFWTAGVQATHVPITPAEPVMDRGGRIQTGACFQVERQKNIFAIGDQCCFIGTDGRPLPGTASQAIDQGEYVARAIVDMSRNQTPPIYECKNFGYVVPLGGKWGIMITPHIYLKGRIAIFARSLIWFNYLKKLIGSRRAAKLIWRQGKIYSSND